MSHEKDAKDHDEQPPPSPELVERRRFLARVSVGLGGCMGVAIAAPMGAFVVAPLFGAVPHEWRAVGKVSGFKVGETTAVIFTDASPLPWAGVTAKTAAWLRRKSEREFVAFAVNCAHLGCPVRWLPDAQLFMCPCHGGVYYSDGSRASGPPERGLFEYSYKVEQGNLMIQPGEMPTPGAPNARLINISSGKTPCA
jgi:menaquinol-cytochrome c reductase iron-sulfur subunit